MKARDNPFRTERLERLQFRLPGVTWGQVFQRLAALHFRAGVVGPQGSGNDHADQAE